MKKLFGAIFGAVVIIALAAGIQMKNKSAASISIIGGADGPTSIFLAGKFDSGTAALEIIGGAVLLLIGFILFRKNKNKDK